MSDTQAYLTAKRDGTFKLLTDLAIDKGKQIGLGEYQLETGTGKGKTVLYYRAPSYEIRVTHGDEVVVERKNYTDPVFKGGAWLDALKKAEGVKDAQS